MLFACGKDWWTRFAIVSAPKATEMLGKLNLGRKPSGSFEQSSSVKYTLGFCTVSCIRGEERVLNLSLNSQPASLLPYKPLQKSPNVWVDGK